MGKGDFLSRMMAWLPLLTLPPAVWGLTPDHWPRWGFMWLLALALFAGCKWLTWQSAALRNVSRARQLGYFFAWPGLDATTFLTPAGPVERRPISLHGWIFALSKLLAGMLLIGCVYPCLPVDWLLLRGWTGMVGIIFVLHFGVFHLLSLGWQHFGVDAKPLMNWPLLSRSVSEFWSRRWNTAFRDLTHRYLFRPLTIRFGAPTAIVIGFLFSGVLHELVISLPAEEGYGGPTIFFMIQAAALLLERSAIGQRFGLARGWRGWAFTLLVLALPAGLLFHPPFVRHVVVPFLDWIVQPLGACPCLSIYQP